MVSLRSSTKTLDCVRACFNLDRLIEACYRDIGNSASQPINVENWLKSYSGLFLKPEAMSVIIDMIWNKYFSFSLGEKGTL